MIVIRLVKTMKLISNAQWKEVAETTLVKDRIKNDSLQKTNQTDSQVNQIVGKKNEQNDDCDTSKCNTKLINYRAIELGI